MLELLKKSLLEAPIIQRGEYRYFIHPITDGIPRLSPELLREVTLALKNFAELNVDYILTVESMGIHIASALALETGLPINIVRKKPYGLKGERILQQETGYGKSKLYVNYVDKGDRIMVVDAVISTGGTLSVVLGALKELGAKVIDAWCVIERGRGVERVKRETGIEVKTLVKIEVSDKVKIISSVV